MSPALLLRLAPRDGDGRENRAGSFHRSTIVTAVFLAFAGVGAGAGATAGAAGGGGAAEEDDNKERVAGGDIGVQCHPCKPSRRGALARCG